MRRDIADQRASSSSRSGGAQPRAAPGSAAATSPSPSMRTSPRRAITSPRGPASASSASGRAADAGVAPASPRGRERRRAGRRRGCRTRAASSSTSRAARLERRPRAPVRWRARRVAVQRLAVQQGLDVSVIISTRSPGARRRCRRTGSGSGSPRGPPPSSCRAAFPGRDACGWIRPGSGSCRRRRRRCCPSQRQHLERVGVVDGLSAGHDGLRELQDHQLPAGLEHAAHRAQRGGLVGDIAQPEADGHAVELPRRRAGTRHWPATQRTLATSPASISRSRPRAASRR